MLKKVLGSKILKLLISVALLYLAFSRVDMGMVLEKLLAAPWWLAVLLLMFNLLGAFLGNWRWAYVALEKVLWKDVLFFTKSSLMAGFYGLFMFSSLGADLVRWVPLVKRYPKLSKGRLMASVAVDRFLGFTGFIVFAFGGLLLAKNRNIQFPEVIFWPFFALFAGVVFFYILLFFVDMARLKFLPDKFGKLLAMIKGQKREKLLIIFCFNLLLQFLVVFQIWAVGGFFGAKANLLSLATVVPVINLLLILPISIAGFGAREQLFMLFFPQIGVQGANALALSAYLGVVGIINSLFGGLLTLL